MSTLILRCFAWGGMGALLTFTGYHLGTLNWWLFMALLAIIAILERKDAHEKMEEK
jgi:hypothetical protein